MGRPRCRQASWRAERGTERLAEAIDLARSGEPVDLTRRGRRVGLVVDAASHDALIEVAEDAMDGAEMEAARTEKDYVPWEEVKADLGLPRCRDVYKG